MHYVFLCDEMTYNENIFSGFAQCLYNLFSILFQGFFMKSIVFLLAIIAMSTSLFAQHQVLGQSPRSAKIYTKQVSNHQVLGQSPRSAKIYNSEYVPVAAKYEVTSQEQESTHLVLGQSPRSAKIHNSAYVPTHIVLGQSPRSAIVYNTEGYELWKYRNGVFNVSIKSVK